MTHKLFIGILFLAPILPLYAIIQLQSITPASGWYEYSKTNVPTKKDWINNFISDCAKLKSQNERIPSHKTNNTTIRIASYNIHFWCKPDVSPFNYATGENRHTAQDIKNNFDTIISVLKCINADIICLQEVLMFNTSLIEETLKRLGYTHVCFFREADWLDPFGILIASKYPFFETPQGKTFEIDTEAGSHPLEKHCFLKVPITLPNNKKATIYTSHFDCSDDSEKIRYEEVGEIIKDIELNSITDNYIICGDFNAVRAQDFQYSITEYTAWDLLNNDNMNRTKMPTQTKALDLLETHKFQDCFNKAKIAMPRFSVWNGTVVDFIFLNQYWNLPIEGCYFYYTPASDHLPVILDVKI